MIVELSAGERHGVLRSAIEYPEARYIKFNRVEPRVYSPDEPFGPTFEATIARSDTGEPSIESVKQLE